MAYFFASRKIEKCNCISLQLPDDLVTVTHKNQIASGLPTVYVLIRSHFPGAGPRPTKQHSECNHYSADNTASMRYLLKYKYKF